ncbi:MAG TPA: type VI secretion system tip protein TssI/VgrG [Candidatus Sulfotelmatobacter sp.]|nr:type VI secretion system tip protein TssI/VgrG [Candidatus Sulfotelmatobacter sp.]
MATYTQKDGLIALSVDGLQEDEVLLQGFTGMEGLSRLFTFHLDLLSQEDSIDFTKVLGKKAVVTIQTAKANTPRYINGYVSRFSQGGFDATFFHYQMEIVPWFWFLTRQADCRIFQGKSVPEIVTEIFDQQKDKSHKADYKMSVNAGDYDKLEYCVQYRETTFNFVSRLLEQEGIFYYFEHTKDSHTLVACDNSVSLPACPVSPTVPYDPTAGTSMGSGEHISNLHAKREFRTGQYTSTDYNFETPSTSLKAGEETVIKVGGNDPYEIFDYPGVHTTLDQGQDYSKIRMEEHEAAHHVVVGSGRVRDFAPGKTFTLSTHYRGDVNSSYLITEIRHSASEGGTYFSDNNAMDENSSIEFHCIPKSIPYRPPRVTPKPFVQGPQPALVVGKENEEIWVDPYGRVVVQFYWDRYGQKNENSSCWIRVSQPWAGGNWGAIWIPRIGQEVLVSFLEGDPDRPVITGRVYNANQMPPYTLPDYQTRSTFKSRSSKGGGASDYNELRFEDLKGQEQIFINAQKDMDLRVENDSREFIGANRHLIVTTNQVEQIQTDKHLHVQGKHFEKVDSDMSLNVGGNQMESVTGNKSLNVTGDQKESVTGNVSLSVTGGKMDSITMGYMMSALSIHLSAETGIVIECPVGITLSSGANSIDIGPAGVFVTGTPFVYLNSGSSPASTSDPSSGSPDSPTAPNDPDTADDGSKGTKLN